VTTLPLFDPRPSADHPESPATNIPVSIPQSDIRRLVMAKPGLFRELREGGEPTGREFYLGELHDGRIVNLFTDGSRGPASPAMSRVLIDDAIRYGTFVEVDL
jgi:hypothetical protein